MKKVIIIIFAVLLLTGCATTRPERVDYKNPQKFEQDLKAHYEQMQKKGRN